MVSVDEIRIKEHKTNRVLNKKKRIFINILYPLNNKHMIIILALNEVYVGPLESIIFDIYSEFIKNNIVKRNS